MAYTANLSSHQQVKIANQGMQTVITLQSSTPGQQQSQSSSFTTGKWNKPPHLYQTESGFVLEINSDTQEHFILIQANSITTIAAPSLQNSIPVNLQNIPDTNQNTPDFEPMQPMQPMQPMKMGNMSMKINPMSMRMGNMSMSMDDNEENKTAKPTKRFCTQCGQEAKIRDRFCASCGNKLDN